MTDRPPPPDPNNPSRSGRRPRGELARPRPTDEWDEVVSAGIGDRPTGIGERPRLDAQDNLGNGTTRVASFIERRWLPRPSTFVPGFVKRRWRAWVANLPPEARRRWEFVSGIGQVVGLIVGGLLALGFLVSILTNATLIEPKSVTAILDGAPKVKRVSYSIETVRTKRIDGAPLRQDTLTGISVDLGSRRFQVQSNGILDAVVRIVGDGKRAVSQRGQNTPGQLGRYPTEDELRPILPQDIAKRAGDIVTNQLTVAGQRGWLVTWNPTREDILRLLAADLLALEGDDVDEIRAGRFAVDYATASINRTTRLPYQLDTTLSVNGAELHVLVTFRDYDPQGLDRLQFKTGDE